ncbi:phenylacetic acid degradation protein [Mycolicibacterium agri]|uniref:Phenylacetic acid degradation protein n=1 Tax=Mycolicibacterium agri TaxID=36811 RepID=A0A2A7MRV7_MYCAG|nr:PaaI family thioesterase [Mycolicibacterium agri]PEG34542.1 phenylacetic acid degradation protein [Mycolicibacterium agri]GFG49741.1 phenylacetic acid degradation protein [Mycolicibacterium agri]
MTETPVTYPVNSALGRFGIAQVADSPDPFVSSMPLAGLVNPVTGLPTVGPLAVLVDHAAGLVNHYRRAADEWTVTSELTLEIAPGALDVVAADPSSVAVATARPTGTRERSALGSCEITVGDTVIAVGTVRSVYITHPGEFAQEWPPLTADDEQRPTELADIMALELDDTDVIRQRENPVLNNSLGIVHGGVSAAGLELAASAALNAGRVDEPLHTASLRVNYLRQFLAGDQSRYVGSVLRVGRRSGVADAQAVGADGEVALIARVTAYR